MTTSEERRKRFAEQFGNEHQDNDDSEKKYTEKGYPGIDAYLDRLVNGKKKQGDS